MPMSLFTANPALAFVPALLFIAAYIHRRVAGGRGFRFSRFVLLAASCVWLIYAIYELGVQEDVKPESVPIRVDLAFIGPALMVVTVLGAAAYLFGFLGRVREGSRGQNAA